MNEVIGIDTMPRYQKGWGYELWVHNDADYCGKELVLYKDKKCSIHFHMVKKETFYVVSGNMIVDLYSRPFEVLLGNLERNLEITVKQLEAEATVENRPPFETKSVHMTSGDSLIIEPRTPHRFRGLADETKFIEFSTTHFEEDSIRLFPGDSQTGG